MDHEILILVKSMNTYRYMYNTSRVQNDQIYALRNDLFTRVSCKPIGLLGVGVYISCSCVESDSLKRVAWKGGGWGIAKIRMRYFLWQIY